jgi:hypothetical protein
VTIALNAADAFDIRIFMSSWKAMDQSATLEFHRKEVDRRYLSVLLETDLMVLIASGGARKPSLYRDSSERRSNSP